MDERDLLQHKSQEELIEIIFRQEDTIKGLSGEVMDYEAQLSQVQHQLNKIATSINIKSPS